MTQLAPPSKSPPSRQRSIVNNELVRCSVSQVKTADERQPGGCLRRWAFEKIDHIESEESPAQRESTKGHTIAEAYLTDGKLPPGDNAIERAFLAGKHLLPVPGEAAPEHPFDGEISLAGVPFNGKLDVWLPEVKTDGLMSWVTVRDHKFLRTLEKGKTGDQMERDAQMVGYGVVAATLAPGVTHVDIGHINYQKEEPRPTPGARLINRLVPIATLRERWQSLEKIVERMKEAARLGEAAKVPGNKKACLAFGEKYACPHLERCAKLQGGTMSTGWSPEEMELFGTMAPQQTVVKAVEVILATPKEALTEVPKEKIAAAAEVVKKSLIIDESTTPDAELKALNGRKFAIGKSYKFADGSVGELMEINGAAGLLRMGTDVSGSRACLLSVLGEETARSAPVRDAANILPPDAPKSDPELAAACPKCENEKNFQHRAVDCPKKDGEPEKKKRGRKTAVASLPVVPVPPEIAAKVEALTTPEAAATLEKIVAAEYVDERVKALRDEFAKAALQGMMTGRDGCNPAVTAQQAYFIADAMLAERSRK